MRAHFVRVRFGNEFIRLELSPLARTGAPDMQCRPRPHSRRRITRRAFTLVELLVVIGIIALLIAILMPSLSRARTQSQRVACMSNLRQLGAAFVMYTNANKGAFPRPAVTPRFERSEERRVGKACRSRWSPSPEKKRS